MSTPIRPDMLRHRYDQIRRSRHHWREETWKLRAILDRLHDCTDPKCALCGNCCQAIWEALHQWHRPAM